ncbi:hypothetical protein ACJX0J_016432, partial [Zea mays]
VFIGHHYSLHALSDNHWAIYDNLEKLEDQQEQYRDWGGNIAIPLAASIETAVLADQWDFFFFIIFILIKHASIKAQMYKMATCRIELVSDLEMIDMWLPC